MARQPARLATWEEILARKDLIGGEVWTYTGKGDDEVLIRANICGFKEEERDMIVVSSWCVKSPPKYLRFGLGRKDHAVHPPRQERIPKSVSTEFYLGNDTTGQRVRCGMPGFGGHSGPNHWHILLPKGDSPFDPKTADNFPEGWERLLALYSNVELNRQAMMEIWNDEGFRGAIGETSFDESILESAVTAEDLVSRLPLNPKEREDLVIHYLEAVTGEEKIHERVY